MHASGPGLGPELAARMADGLRGGQWYGGPVADQPTGAWCGRRTARGAVRCGPVGRLVPPADRAYPGLPIGPRRPRPRPCRTWRSSRPPADTARPSVGPIVTSAHGGHGADRRRPRPRLHRVRHAGPDACSCPGGQRDAGQMAAGMAIWAIALVAPAALHPARDQPPGPDAGARQRPRSRDARSTAVGPVRPARRRRRGQRHHPARRPAGPGPHRRTVRRRRRPRAAAGRRRCASRTGTGSCARSAAGSRWRTRCTGPSATASASAAGWPTTTPTSWSRSTPRSSVATCRVAADDRLRRA